VRADRRRQLQRLQQDVGRLRAELAEIQEQTRGLLLAEGERLLTKVEAAQVAAIQQRSERLRWELLTLRREFAQLNDGELEKGPQPSPV
jgi:hypothetical protein